MGTLTKIWKSGIGLPHSMTLARIPKRRYFRQVLECGSPMPLFPRFVQDTCRYSRGLAADFLVRFSNDPALTLTRPANYTYHSLTSNLISGCATATTWSGWPNPGGVERRVDQRAIGAYPTLPVWMRAFSSSDDTA